jgi:aspartate/glutamate/glutamine transport system permease protein
VGYKVIMGPFAWFKWEALFKNFDVFLKGLGTTVLASVLALSLALILGIIFGVLGSTRIKGLRYINKAYVSFFQNTPLIIQIFFLYNGLPHMKIMLPVLAVGVLGVGIYHGAYISEVVRGGIAAVPKGQMEAASSQGFTYLEAMRHIIIPQARKIILPPLTNQAVSLIKNTSIMAVVAGGDLMYSADSWSSNNLYYGPAYVMTGLLYLALCLPLSNFARGLENKNKLSKAVGA